MIFTINPIIFFVTGLIPTVLGMFWYSPLLFSKPWLRALGINLEDIQDSGVNPALGYIASTVLGYVLTYGMGVIVQSLGITGFHIGALLGFAVWLAFNFSATAKYIFFEDRPLALVLIDGGYDLLSYVLIGGILGIWI